MDYLRDLSDFIDDLPDRNPFDPVIIKLPELEHKMTALLRKLRTQMDQFKIAQRDYRQYQSASATMSATSSGTSFSASRGSNQESSRTPRSNSQFRREFAKTTPNNLDLHWAAARQRSVKRDYYRAGPRSSHPYETGSDGITSDSRLDHGSDYALMIPRPITADQSMVPHEIEVPVSQNMVLHCIEISDVNYIRRDGVLYYIPRIKRFAIKLAGFVLQGNIGTVYVSEPLPQKIRDCEMRPTCGISTCCYYHNPLRYPGSTDIRNFAATSWLYHQGTQVSGNKRMRKLASRPSLDNDILTITSADLAFYNEQMMHDLLCNIIMNYYVRVGAGSGTP